MSIPSSKKPLLGGGGRLQSRYAAQAQENEGPVPSIAAKSRTRIPFAKTPSHMTTHASCGPPPSSTPLRTPLRTVQPPDATPPHQLTSNRMATLPRCSKQSQGHLLCTPTSNRKGTKLENQSQNLFNRLVRSTIKRSSRVEESDSIKPRPSQEDSTRLKLESKLTEDSSSSDTTTADAATRTASSTSGYASSKQEVFNFYEYEEELLKVVWERVAPMQHQRCTNPVAKWLDRHVFIPVHSDKTGRQGLLVKH